MTSLANVIRDEAKALEAIAVAPLPDSSFLDAAECSHKDGEQRSHAKHADTDCLDVSRLHNEIKALLEIESSRSTWSLDLLGDTIVPDIRTLKPDASRLLNDPDGDKASLYWYVRTKSIAEPQHDFAHQDHTFHNLADRVSFGFSTQSIKAQAEQNADVQTTRLADELMKAMEAVKTLQKHKSRREEEDAVSPAQQCDEHNQHATRQNALDVSRDEAAKKNITINITTTTSTTNQLSKSLTNHHKGIPHSSQSPPINPNDLNQIRSSSKPESTHCPNRAENLLHGFTVSHTQNVDNTVSPDESKAHSWFVDGFISEIQNMDLDGTVNFALGYDNVVLSCRRVREIFRPLLAGFSKAGSIYGVSDPSVLVDVIHQYVKSRSEILTSMAFVGMVLAVASSLSDSLVDTMGGKEAVVQASLLLYKHFVSDNNLLGDEMREFLRDLPTSGESRIPALFLGRLLDKAGSKDGKSGLHVVSSFERAHVHTSSDIPQPTFLKWLASLKPKFSANEMEEILTDITCPTDSNLISMSRFVQICLPAPKCNSGSLKRKLEFISSDSVVGPTWVDQVIGSCQEKDVSRSGLVGWKEFLEASNVLISAKLRLVALFLCLCLIVPSNYKGS